jgi:hypothetical protein
MPADFLLDAAPSAPHHFASLISNPKLRSHVTVSSSETNLKIGSIGTILLDQAIRRRQPIGRHRDADPLGGV